MIKSEVRDSPEAVEFRKNRSRYHFDPLRFDPEWDKVTMRGKFIGSWGDELTAVINNSVPMSKINRFYGPKKSEELGIIDSTVDKTGKSQDHRCNVEMNVTGIFKKMADSFALDQPIHRIHIHKQGDWMPVHIDDIDSFYPGVAFEKLARIIVCLTDYKPGQFSQFGNYNLQSWTAGDTLTFDWLNMPHCCANSGTDVRVFLIVTGILTSKSQEFLLKLSNNIKVEDL